MESITLSSKKHIS